MTKGTSRRVIVVDSPDTGLFEQAIFILKDEALRSGHFEKCVAWLKEHIHRYGCRYDAPEIMHIATGSDFDVKCTINRYISSENF